MGTGHVCRQQASGVPESPKVPWHMHGSDNFLQATHRRCQGQGDIKDLTHPTSRCCYDMGTCSKMLRLSTQALVFSAAEYCVQPGAEANK